MCLLIGQVGSAGGGASFDHLGWRWSSLVVAGLQALAVMTVVSMVSISLVGGNKENVKAGETGSATDRILNFSPYINQFSSSYQHRQRQLK